MPDLHNDNPGALAEVFRPMSDSELLQEWEKWKITASTAKEAVRSELERRGIAVTQPA